MAKEKKESKRHAYDFYKTPPSAIYPFLDKCSRLGLVRASEEFLWLEPCAGDGAIINACTNYWHTRPTQPTWMAIEIQKELKAPLKQTAAQAVLIQDYLRYIPDPGLEPDIIFSNPPFTYAREIIEHSKTIVKPDGDIVMLLRLAFTESQERWEFWESQIKKPDLYILHKRPAFTEDGKTDSCAYAFFHWWSGSTGKWDII